MVTLSQKNPVRIAVAVAVYAVGRFAKRAVSRG